MWTMLCVMAFQCCASVYAQAKVRNCKKRIQEVYVATTKVRIKESRRSRAQMFVPC
jgi:hypothetical protein